MAMKIAVCILAYDNWQRVNATMERFVKETDTTGLDISRYVFYVGYPLPSTRENFDNIMTASKMHQWKLCVMDNKGQDGNIRQMAEMLNGKADIFVPYDTDVAPRDPMWLKDAIKVFEADAKCAAVTMNCKITDDALCQQRHHDDVGGVPVKELIWPGGWPITMMRMSWLIQGYEQWHSYYGGTEGAILKAIRERDMIGYMLTNHDDGRCLNGQDVEYQHWKAYAIAKPDAKSFEEWLDIERKSKAQPHS